MSGARVRHETPHPARSQAPTPGEIIPDYSNDPHKPKLPINDSFSPTPLQGGTNFSFNTLSIIPP